MSQFTPTSNPFQGKYLVMVALAIAVAVGGYFILNAPDQRSPGDKIGDAINELPNGVDKAVRELEDRTPGEKLGDAIEDAGDDLK
ncbi:MAG TPA: hypothetical protein VFW37_11035 [Alphaproteobacteria bacterium]|nr:hypothetical protein [Alphaproteobacteria bacterium]